MTYFDFDDDPCVETENCFYIDKYIDCEKDLLMRLARVLMLPDYYGENWNALDECICDLSWLPPGDVVIVHRDLPLKDNRAAMVLYVVVLRDAVVNWRALGSNLMYVSGGKPMKSGECLSLRFRKFRVVFPKDCKNYIEDLLAIIGSRD